MTCARLARRCGAHLLQYTLVVYAPIVAYLTTYLRISGIASPCHRRCATARFPSSQLVRRILEAIKPHSLLSIFPNSLLGHSGLVLYSTVRYFRSKTTKQFPPNCVLRMSVVTHW